MAAYKKPVYCDFEFLKKLRSSNGRFSPFGSNDAMQMWLNTIKFLLKSKVQLNIDTQTFQKQIRKRDGDTFFELWKRVANGECEISFLEEHNVKFYEQRLISAEGLMNAYLINEKKAIVNHHGKKYGIVTITPDCWQDNESARQKSYLFTECGWAAQKGEYSSWAEILRSKEYKLSDCNSMIIIDNYILKEDATIENNLFPILKELLPSELDRKVEFHLTIITESNEKDDQYFHKKYSLINKKIEGWFPNLKLQFDLYVQTGKGKFHDRVIITNNAMISCEGGFDLIGKDGKAKKLTQWHIIHQGIHACDGGYDVNYRNTISQALKVIRKIKSDGGGKCYSRNCKFFNRLLNLDAETM